MLPLLPTQPHYAYANHYETKNQSIHIHGEGGAMTNISTGPWIIIIIQTQGPTSAIDGDPPDDGFLLSGVVGISDRSCLLVV